MTGSIHIPRFYVARWITSPSKTSISPRKETGAGHEGLGTSFLNTWLVKLALETKALSRLSRVVPPSNSLQWTFGGWKGAGSVRVFCLVMALVAHVAFTSGKRGTRTCNQPGYASLFVTRQQTHTAFVYHVNMLEMRVRQLQVRSNFRCTAVSYTRHTGAIFLRGVPYPARVIQRGGTTSSTCENSDGRAFVTLDF